MNHVPIPKNNFLKKNVNIKPLNKNIKAASATKSFKMTPMKKNQKVVTQQIKVIEKKSVVSAAPKIKKIDPVQLFEFQLNELEGACERANAKIEKDLKQFLDTDNMNDKSPFYRHRSDVISATKGLEKLY